MTAMRDYFGVEVQPGDRVLITGSSWNGFVERFVARVVYQYGNKTLLTAYNLEELEQYNNGLLGNWGLIGIRGDFIVLDESTRLPKINLIQNETRQGN